MNFYICKFMCKYNHEGIESQVTFGYVPFKKLVMNW